MSGLRDHRLRLLISSNVVGGRVDGKVVQAAMKMCGCRRPGQWRSTDLVLLEDLRSILDIPPDQWTELLQPTPLPVGLQLVMRSDSLSSLSSYCPSPSLSSHSQSRIHELEAKLAEMEERAIAAEHQAKHVSRRERDRKRYHRHRECDMKRRRKNTAQDDSLVLSSTRVRCRIKSCSLLALGIRKAIGGYASGRATSQLLLGACCRQTVYTAELTVNYARLWQSRAFQRSMFAFVDCTATGSAAEKTLIGCVLLQGDATNSKIWKNNKLHVLRVYSSYVMQKVEDGEPKFVCMDDDIVCDLQLVHMKIIT